MYADKNAMTVPAMPAVISRGKKPTLIFKMNVDVQEEEKKEREGRGRYSIIVPREVLTLKVG
jgi:hypothetical protein